MKHTEILLIFMRGRFAFIFNAFITYCVYVFRQSLLALVLVHQKVIWRKERRETEGRKVTQDLQDLQE